MNIARNVLLFEFIPPFTYFIVPVDKLKIWYIVVPETQTFVKRYNIFEYLYYILLSAVLTIKILSDYITAKII